MHHHLNGCHWCDKSIHLTRGHALFPSCVHRNSNRNGAPICQRLIDSVCGDLFEFVPNKRDMHRLGGLHSLIDTIYFLYLICCLHDGNKSRDRYCAVKGPHPKCKCRQANDKKRTRSVRPALKPNSVSFASANVHLVWRHIVFVETLMFSKSPSVVSHRPHPLPITLPPFPFPPHPPPPPPPSIHLTLLHLDRKEFIAQLRLSLH